MKTILLTTLGCLAAGALQAEVGKEITTRYAVPAPPRSEIRMPATNNVVRWSKTPGVTYSGVVVQAARTSNPLQLINPFAPASYGHAEANLVRDPITGQPDGIKLFSIGF